MLQNRKRNRTKRNLCRCCGQNPCFGQSKLCEEHFYKSLAANSVGTNNWAYIRNLAIEQNFKCAKTRVKLIPGWNMSLDHIISKHERPDLAKDLTNVQWVAWRVNESKGIFSNDDFDDLCELIYRQKQGEDVQAEGRLLEILMSPRKSTKKKDDVV